MSLIHIPPQSRKGLSRRSVLASLTGGAAFIASGGILLKPTESWAVELKALKPETMRTLIQMARDIYPHDRFPDKIYAVAVKGHDDAAAADPAAKEMIEKGIASLNELAQAKHKTPYADIGWEIERVGLLRTLEDTPFFQAIRGGLVVSLYNQEEVWPYFGYEGESYSKGGYIARGFDDIAWL
jgi:hypothetical protein